MDQQEPRQDHAAHVNDAHPRPDKPAVPPAAAPLLADPAAARVRRYARILVGHGVSAGAFIVAGAAFLAKSLNTHDWTDGLLAVVLALAGVGQGLIGWVRYRQLARYLRCGSATKFEDLVRDAENTHRGPDNP